jgi:transcriptional regulator with XRE-family HTH domain
LDNGRVDAGIGERLRDARRDLGLDLEEITARTKIRARYLIAMEEERWEALPGAAYVRSFLHTYAEVLGLDADALLDEYRSVEPARDRPGVEAPPPASIAPTPIGPMPSDEPRARGRRPGGRWAPIAGAVVAGVLAIVAVIGLMGGSDDDDGAPAKGQRAAGQQGGGGRGGSAQEKAPTPEPSRATLRLTTTGTVWVCVVDRSGEPLVEGVTLPAGEVEGPFRGGGFDVGLGNGLVEMEANGKPVPIPAAAEPVGFRVTPEGTRELDSAERPTCV